MPGARRDLTIPRYLLVRDTHEEDLIRSAARFLRMANNNDNQDERTNDVRELARIIQQSQKDQIPKIDVPLFDGNNVSGWAEKFEQLGSCCEWSNEKMLQMVKRYCKIQYKEEVEELVQDSLDWAEFKRKLLEKYQLSDQLLDLTDLRKVKENRERIQLGTDKDREVYKTLSDMKEMMTSMKEERLKLQVMMTKAKTRKRKGKEPVTEESSSESESEEERETPHKLTKAERKTLNQIRGGQGTSRKQRESSKNGGNGSGERQVDQGQQNQGQQTQPQGGEGRVRGRGNGGGRGNWQEYVCKYCDLKGHVIRFCQILAKDENDHIVFTTIRGEVFNFEGNLIDQDIEGGMRKEVFRRMGRPLPATFRLDSPEEASLFELEETMTSLEIGQDGSVPAAASAQEVMPMIRPMMMSRPVLKRGMPTVMVQTRKGRKTSQSQSAPGENSKEPKEKEPIQIEEGDDEEEDERLRAEDELLAKQRAMERASEAGKTQVEEEEPRKKKNVYSIPVEQGIDFEQLVDRILESRHDLVTLKEILAVSSKLREEFKQRMTRKKVMTVKLSEIISPEANWAPPGTKMDWRCVATCLIKVQIGHGEFSALIDDGAEMSIMRERHAIEAGFQINRNDFGYLIGASGATPFCGTASGVMVTVGKVKARSYFYILSKVEHEVFLGRSFQCRTESIIFNKHDGDMFVALCDPVCDYYEVVKLDVDMIPMIWIHTIPHEPWNVGGPRYPNPDDHWKVVDYLDGKIRTKVADYSYGLYASPWFCFIKPNGVLRWVHDLQKLNSVTVRDAGGLPNADQLSESCAGQPIITLIDLYSGYDQFPLYTADRPMTAMHTPRGLLHMCAAPQGWTNVVAIVQRYMMRVMQPLCPDVTSPYIDDLAIPGPRVKDETEVLPGVRKFVWEHISNVEKVLRKLNEYNLTASGVKIEAWFAARVEHLRKLVRKNQVWEWGPKQQASVEDIKAEFREGGLILGVPCFDDAESRPFIIETDADPTALGGVLVQKDGEGRERPLRFESRTLNITERNYSQFKKETLAVLHCLRIFRNYVFGRRFILRVDLTALAESLKNYSPSDPTIARRLTYIWMFNFEIERISGAQNRADGLSRVDWDLSTDQAEDSVPVDGFLEGEESQLSINSYNYLADATTRNGKTIWNAPCFHHVRSELVIGDPFIEEDPWGERTSEQMMNLALSDEVELIKEPLTIEYGHEQADKTFRITGEMSFLVNSLIHEDRLKMMNEEAEGNEIREAFREGEYDGEYKLMGMWLNGELREDEVDPDIRQKTECIEEYYLRYPFVREIVMDRGGEFRVGEVQVLLKQLGVSFSYTTRAHPQANAPL
ncbi:hypothetical protein CBR_g51520 [Chara braunii]|uniref:RNA-directed DNA polymerase n=1 Tax=Chara braunii TaxID=69332 RepID=A0A388M8S8_CHABU|nr:hypothetical protein CBR_g51520 [Chara braunii]|eukprot:GBG90915.1 hypothetical protein CBR_g51520 [Chara braunii]